MVRIEFNIRKAQVQDIYDALDSVEHQFEMRYGVFRQGSTFAEIITSDEGQNEIKAVLNKFGIKYELVSIFD